MDIFINNKITLLLIVIFMMLISTLLYLSIKAVKTKNYKILEKYLSLYIMGVFVTGILAIINILLNK
ncbi:hypothetical protein ABGF49_05635 [Helcococcus ovis]|uniref:Uncharacterized protein n=1 Tax=Helcococcus ovis TaxID=72026 RepID=A0A4R9C585_9FIRM|nr:hypothetical protein [Helcococcus ovis]TFF66137.1 hypothetical protein EQF93_07595 [Helcococcus ovis]TFF67014.1 hypothetical protein EQF91_02495 [Helcococcus ovis]WNZ01351.1 hypothetical protein EQF90_000430 [Helcococcus ovis]